MLNYRKCTFGVEEIDFLGFTIKNARIYIKSEQLSKTAELTAPRNLKELRALLGFTAFFKRFIPAYTDKIYPLLKLLKKGAFYFGEEEEECLKNSKNYILKAKALILPNNNGRFYIYADASDIALGAALTQKIEGEENTVTWASRKLTAAELNYTTTEKECLAIIWAIFKFKIYLYNEFTIKTDHSALTWLFSQKDPKGRIARWIIGIQEFKFKIEHISGKDNVIADAPSRGMLKNNVCKLLNTEKEITDDEKFLYMAKAHEETGHAGIESTYIFMKNTNKCWPSLYNDLKDFIKKCDVCLRFKDRNKHSIKSRLKLMEPFHRIGIDLVGPLPRSARGNRSSDSMGRGKAY